MLLVVTYSRAARRDLRNVCRRHESCVAQQLGRAALFEGTEFGAFQALRLREKHDLAVRVERLEPFGPEDVPAHVAEAARAYEQRTEPATPYERFAAGRDLPAPASMREEPL
ncbi:MULTISPECIES: hypothetical protein [Haloarcula]|uniref:DUF7855 family protein n=1 Tax=Haloarcula TaxID=2237 RepID=UPI0023EB6CCA|nr:hypothetical protein [Halomicroarcula sp. XH51]